MGTTVEANWKPLENRLGRKRCVGFMYMRRVNGINLYKHGITRSYLNYVEFLSFFRRLVLASDYSFLQNFGARKRNEVITITVTPEPTKSTVKPILLMAPDKM